MIGDDLLAVIISVASDILSGDFYTPPPILGFLIDQRHNLLCGAVEPLSFSPYEKSSISPPLVMCDSRLPI